jgi:hypothetical protein
VLSSTPRTRAATTWRIRAFLRALPWVHLGIGLTGNVTLVVGSVLFLV